MSPTIRAAYDADHFRKQGYELIDLLANYLEQAQEGTPMDVFKWEEPNAVFAQWEDKLGNPDLDMNSIFADILAQSTRTFHPNYVGHQVNAPVPIASLASLFSSFVNNGMGVYEMGAAATAIERLVVKRIAKAIGYATNSDGILTSGGTLGNLTALLTARSVQNNPNVWEAGNQQQYAVLVSEEAHYCVDRAVRIMGWGSEGIIKVPTNAALQMRTDLLPELYEKAISEDKQIVAIVGCASTTSTGSFDDLEAIADFAAAHQIWFHVDGAHGGGTVFAPKYKHLVKGIERADSIVIDFHKMLALPALTTGVFYRNGSTAYQTFAQQAHYLWSNAATAEWHNLGKRTFECTKLMMSVKVFSVLHEYGTQLWTDTITQLYDLGQAFAKLIDAQADFELALSPECNIVCFRYTPPNTTDLNALNLGIRQRLLEDGSFYCVQTNLDGTVYLRTALMNSFTRLEDLEELLVLLRKFAALV